MDKKTKMWLGVGVVGVGAYLLWKSKQPKATTTTTTAPAGATAPAKFVGANSFASVGDNQKFTNLAGGVMSSRMKSANGDFASVGERMVSANGFGSVGARQIAATGGMINSTDVVGARAGSQNSGIFANQPFTGDVANMVGASGEKVFANQSGKFFDPRTAKYGQNQGVFASSTEKPLNNLVGQDGSRFFSVHDGFGK
jgi:hypothetical protein